MRKGAVGDAGVGEVRGAMGGRGGGGGRLERR